MDTKVTTCDVISASQQASEWKKSFICANDDLHQAMLELPISYICLCIWRFVGDVFGATFFASKPFGNEEKVSNKKRLRQNSRRDD